MRHALTILFCLFSTLGFAAEPLQFFFDTVQVDSKAQPSKSWKANPTRILTASAVAANPPDALDEFGGTLDYPVEPATGFFYTKQIDGRWWLINPAGRRFIHAGVVAVNNTSSPAAKRAYTQHFGSMAKWINATSKLLHDYGFNGAGAWSDTSTLARPESRMPHARLVNFMTDYGKQRGGTFQKPGHTGYPNDAIFVFDPEFAVFAERYAQKLAAEKDNPWLIGWFSDNEMPLYDKSLERFLRLPETDPGYQAAKAWIEQRLGAPLGEKPWAFSHEEQQAFVAYVYATYLRIVSTAIKKYDPNHLYLGSRLHSDEMRNPHLWRAAGPYLDVVSVNYYRSWAPDAQTLANWTAWSGKPVMITEWYTKGEDTGLPNTTGAGAIVKTQAERGLFYQNFTLSLLQSRNVVGWHWFKYQDNDPDDPNAEPSNRDANKGIVDIRYQPYLPLLQKAGEVNLRKYRLIRFFDQPAQR